MRKKGLFPLILGLLLLTVFRGLHLHPRFLQTMSKKSCSRSGSP